MRALVVVLVLVACDAPTVEVAPGFGNSVQCSDFTSQEEAQSWFDRYYPDLGDVARLDRDGYGKACEQLPSKAVAPVTVGEFCQVRCAEPTVRFVRPYEPPPGPVTDRRVRAR